MKKGIVIGASSDAIHAIQMAQKHGIYVVALDGNPEAKALAYADERMVVDISDLQKVCEKVATIQPDFAIPIPIGKYLSTMGYINDKFRLRGVRWEATRISTDKYIFHQILNDAGLRNVKAYLINHETDVASIDIQYPVILKPRFGSGSRDVFYLESRNELDLAIQVIKKINEDFVLEQAVAGTEYGLDGAVFDGTLYITLLRKKIITPLPVRQAVASITETDLELYCKVSEFMQKVVGLLEYDNCLINADLIINEDEIFLIEAAPRPSGHNLHDVFVPMATKIDLVDEYIKYLEDKPYKFIADKIENMEIRFFDFEKVRVKGTPKYEKLKKTLGDSLVLWSCNIKEGDYLGGVTDGHSVIDRGFFVIKGTSEEDVIQKCNWTISQFEMEREENY